MWFRVELHKDGSVASCETVEGKLKDGKHVFYVEADTKEGALTAAVTSYRKFQERVSRKNAKRYAAIKASGRCIGFGRTCHNRPIVGALRCEPCRAASVASGRTDREARRAGSEPRAKPSEIERAARYRESTQERNRRSRAAIRDAFGLEPKTYFVQKRALLEVLAAYDANPRGFRSWLVAKLASLGVDVEKKGAEPFAFESAAE